MERGKSTNKNRFIYTLNFHCKFIYKFTTTEKNEYKNSMLIVMQFR